MLHEHPESGSKKERNVRVEFVVNMASNLIVSPKGLVRKIE